MTETQRKSETVVTQKEKKVSRTENYETDREVGPFNILLILGIFLFVVGVIIVYYEWSQLNFASWSLIFQYIDPILDPIGNWIAAGILIAAFGAAFMIMSTAYRRRLEHRIYIKKQQQITNNKSRP